MSDERTKSRESGAVDHAKHAILEIGRYVEEVSVIRYQGNVLALRNGDEDHGCPSLTELKIAAKCNLCGREE